MDTGFRPVRPLGNYSTGLFSKVLQPLPAVDEDLQASAFVRGYEKIRVDNSLFSLIKSGFVELIQI